MLFYAVIGASRGIGLEYVRQLATRSDTMVFAVVRDPEGSKYLKGVAASFKNVHIIPGDVVDYGSLEHAAKKVSNVTGGKLDYLIHNAANTDLRTINKGFDDYANMEELDTALISAYKVNSLGPIHAITAFLPLLRASSAKKIIVLGSGAGDPKTALAGSVPNFLAYSMTKAAALVATTKFAVKLRDEGFVVVTFCPGRVDCSATLSAECRKALVEIRKVSSSMEDHFGADMALQSPEASVGAQLKVIDGLQASHNGLFLLHTGEEHSPTR